MIIKPEINTLISSTKDWVGYTDLSLFKGDKNIAIQEILHAKNLTRKDVLKDEKGKPHLKNNLKHISFSHSKKSAAVVISDENVGIDIEEQRVQLLKIQDKFVGNSEKSCKNNLEELTWLWTCKEAIFKIFGSELPFIEGIICEKLPSNLYHTEVLFRIEREKTFFCHTNSSLLIDGQTLTVAKILK